MAPESIGRRLLAALAGSTPAFTYRSPHEDQRRERRLLAALSGSTPAFTPDDDTDQHRSLPHSPTHTTSSDTLLILKKIRIFLVDDHEIVRRGVADLLEDEPDLEIAGEAATVAEALDRIPRQHVDVAILDIRMPDGNGIELCRDLRSQLPDLRCLILTSYSDDEALLNAVLAGASGFVLKQVLGNDLITAVRTVASGTSLLDSDTTARLMKRLQNPTEVDSGALSGLSDQELRVLNLVSEGLTNRQIAARLFLAEQTVKNYVSHLLAKLASKRRTVRTTETNSPKQD